MPVAVRNVHRTHVTFSSPDPSIQAIEWQPFGDPDGGDIQQVSEQIAQNTNFLRAVGIGLLQIEEDTAFAEAIAKQAARFQRTTTAEAKGIEGLLDDTSATGVIRITEDQIDAHIESLSKSQKSDLSNLGEDQ